MEEQISHLRAQLLRSEQDNELMRIKLEQETAEREKAQKQVCGVLCVLLCACGCGKPGCNIKLGCC